MAKKKTKETKEPKKTLLELVMESNVRYASIIMNLSREGLLGQLERKRKIQLWFTYNTFINTSRI